MSTASNAAKTPISTPKINVVPRPDRNVATTGAAIPAAGTPLFGQECLSSKKGELVELLPAVRDDTQDRQCYMVRAAMIVNMLDVSNIAVFVGRDVGKSEQHHGLPGDGIRPTEKYANAWTGPESMKDLSHRRGVVPTVRASRRQRRIDMLASSYGMPGAPPGPAGSRVSETFGQAPP
jgi:hypothetical protein